MRIAEFRADNFKVFSRMNEENRTANINALNYIQFLATASKTNIETWDINALFCSRGNTLIQDKGEINKAFFIEKGKREREPNATQVLSDEVVKLVDEKIGVLANTEASRHQRDAESYKDRMINAIRSVESHREQYIRAMELYEQAKNRTASFFSPQLKQILEAGFWKFEGIQNDSVILSTVNRVTMREYNPAASVDYTVDLGNYSLWLRPSTARARLMPWIDSFRCDGTFYHPYVYTSGEICFGNVSDQAGMMLADGRYFEFASLVASLLMTYSPSSTPYVRLSHFRAQTQRRDFERASLRELTSGSFPNSYNDFVNRRIAEQSIECVVEESEEEVSEASLPF